MRPAKFLRSCVALAALWAASGLQAGGLIDALAPADAARVRAGGQVLVTEDVSGLPWPRARIYQAVEATPEEVMAVFFDYDNACDFVPNCQKSKISKVIDPVTCEVDYVVAVPILADEAYTARNSLHAEEGGRLVVEWSVLRASSIKSSMGSFTVEPFGEGSILCYKNLVEPSSQAAMLLKGVAMGQMRDTVSALVAQVKRKRADQPGKLQAQVGRMRAALGAQ
jgi:hypothetical protein